jgi:hypothetical protein
VRARGNPSKDLKQRTKNMGEIKRIDPLIVKEFKDEVIKLCKKYNLSIGHEDTYGAFTIEPYKESNIEWFKEAYIYVNEKVQREEQ